MVFKQEQMPTRLHIRDLTGLDAEVRAIVELMHPDFDFTFYKRVFSDIVRMFIGDYEGYRASNTAYHDLTHTLSVLLATARLLHGVHLARGPLSERGVLLGLVCALLHDIGYIMTENDLEGTGAKYTFTHVSRGIEFMDSYFAKNGRPEEDARDAETIIRTTDLAASVPDIPYSTPEIKTIGQIIGTTDLLAQMGDELYPERLGDLHKEFEEGGVPGFDTEFILVRETAAFVTIMDGRLKNILDDVASSMSAHFEARWGINLDIYRTFIEKNIHYLEEIVDEHGPEYHTQLRRNGDRRPPFV
ncbi:MAG: HD domain-containing protein [Proteobacteria bacterium]|nr:HD domain-containing protein [Pseudomonadota bacterium]MBU1611178.1 HD domain-containing protein [Pseudomonadota bacterium]